MRLRLLETLTLLLLAIQCLCTLNLWGIEHSYPRIPLLMLPFEGMGWLDGLAAGLAVFGGLLILCGLLLRTKLALPLRGYGWGLMTISLSGLVLLDQHRLQVWVWQVILYAICFAGLPVAEQEKWLRRLTISIYFYSAVSKADFAFLQTYGQTLLDGLFRSLQWTPPMNAQLRWGLVLLFPIGELLTAVLLMFRKTRLIGWGFSLIMHISLFLTLGPWGLQHHAPVLIWNLFFMLQNTLLFTDLLKISNRSTSEDLLSEAIEHKSDAPQPAEKNRPCLAAVLLWGALLFPATEWGDVCDLWPGWGLYSARGARVRLYLPMDQTHRLPAELKPFLQPPSLTSDLQMLDLHRWSFAELSVPSYPEDRFQLAVAATVLKRLGEIEFQIIHESTAHRLTGKRRQTVLPNEQELQRFAQNYWLNLQPRGETSLIQGPQSPGQTH